VSAHDRLEEVPMILLRDLVHQSVRDGKSRETNNRWVVILHVIFDVVEAGGRSKPSISLSVSIHY